MHHRHNFPYHWQHSWLLPAIVLVGVLLPIWIGPQPPLLDYPNHLVEAEIVASYDDPSFNYMAGYEIRPDWYLRSNALMPLLVVGLRQFLPSVLIAGKLVLSAYLLLFVSGLWMLLQRRQTVWPLLLLAPVLAYTLIFLSGWINFSLALALSLHALAVYERWHTQPRWYLLLALAGLCVLIYVAHLLVWLLLVLVIGVLAAGSTAPLRRHVLLWLALNSAAPLLLLTRPPFIVFSLALPPLLLGVGLVIRRVRIHPLILVAAGLALTYAGFIGSQISALKPLREQFNVSIYGSFKYLSLMSTFMLPYYEQLLNPWISAYNIVMLCLLLILVLLLIWSTWICFEQQQYPWLAAVGMLAMLYIILPSGTMDIQIVEPRVLAFAMLIALLTARLPAAGRLRRAIVVCSLAIGVLSIGGMTAYALDYNRLARGWQTQMDALEPARNVLLLIGEQPPGDEPVGLPGSVRYDSSHFTTIYLLRQGGFSSRVFNNGPVRPRSTFPTPWYFPREVSHPDFVLQQCPVLRSTYDVVVVLHMPEAALLQALDGCLGDRSVQVEPDMMFWMTRQME